MFELLVAILILIISTAMYGLIVFMLKIDKRINDFSLVLEDFKKTDFGKLRNFINSLNKINRYVRLSKIKYYVEIGLTFFSTVKMFLLLKKLANK